MGGDSPEHGDHPQAKPVFDLTASGLLAAGEALRNGKDLAGNALAGTPDLFLGATCNPGAPNFEAEVENTRRKIDAGARLLQTQALYHVEPLQRFMDAVKPDGVAILAGVIPLKSERSAPWLHANLPGVAVPVAMQAEMETAASLGGVRDKGIELAAKVISEMREVCQGVHIMAIGLEAEVPQILRAAGVRRDFP
jgi:5,10-methylenetetrahydrofolate reductase